MLGRHKSNRPRHTLNVCILVSRYATAWDPVSEPTTFHVAQCAGFSEPRKTYILRFFLALAATNLLAMSTFHANCFGFQVAPWRGHRMGSGRHHITSCGRTLKQSSSFSEKPPGRTRSNCDALGSHRKPQAFCPDFGIVQKSSVFCGRISTAAFFGRVLLRGSRMHLCF